MRLTMSLRVASVMIGGSPSTCSGGRRAPMVFRAPAISAVTTPVAHGVEHGLEAVVGLAVDLAELPDVQRRPDAAEVEQPVGSDRAALRRRTRPHLRVEEPERPVVIVDVAQLVAARRHRRQLVRVAEHHDLHAAERLGAAPTRLTQRAVDGIHQVGVHHRDLVDDERVDRVQDLARRLGLLELAVGDQPDRQAEQRVDRLPLDVERRDTGGRAHRDLLVRVPREVLQERRLAGAGAPRDEDVLAGVLDEPEQLLLFR